MNILVTNDDGIGSEGLRVLAESLTHLGDVTVMAPDREHSGSGMAVGPLLGVVSRVQRASLGALDDVWTIDGTPALGVMFALRGLFDKSFDLVVSGINPGANCGPNIYFSGTVGAAVVARNLGVSGVAVSQMTSFQEVHGQGKANGQQWTSAATVATGIVEGLIAHPPETACALNVNVPNKAFDQIRGIRLAEVARNSGRDGARAILKESSEGADTYSAHYESGRAVPSHGQFDDAIVKSDSVSLSILGFLDHHEPASFTDLVDRIVTASSHLKFSK